MANDFEDFSFESKEEMEKLAGEAVSGFTPIPAGWYIVTIMDVKFEFGKTDDRVKRMVLELSVKDHPELSGRTLFDRMITKHPTSTQAVTIAAKKAASLFVATNNLPRPKSNADLIGKTVECKVKIKPAKGDYEAGNEINAYRKALAGSDDAPTFGRAAGDSSDIPF